MLYCLWIPMFTRASKLLVIAAAGVVHLCGQAANIPVNAPYAQNLIVATKAGHPELQKLGLHVIPPDQHDYFIVANAIPNKIGK
jgi:hypothetical protein